jgi:uncharacterized protein
MEFRSFNADLSVGSKRQLGGIVVPFGLDHRIDERLTERFESIAFRHQYRAVNRVRLLNYHSNQPGHDILGRCVELREDPSGLWGEFRVTESDRGDHFLALVKDGTLEQWSIGFKPEQTRSDGRTTVYTKATLFETALVPEGAYGELAVVGAIRAALPVLTRDTLLARMPKPAFPA